MKRIAFYGGSFDPVHNGHIKIAQKLVNLFELDEFVFVPAFHAPHKKDKKPTSAFQRYAMLCLATKDEGKIGVSKVELDLPSKPYTIETLTKLKTALPKQKIFFVMGADSWQEITTWKEWEKVLTVVNIIVVTRPPIGIEFSHVTPEIQERIVDLRGKMNFELSDEDKIYITDAVSLDISSTEIRNKIREQTTGWRDNVPFEVANYIEKYKIY
ncbi:MAG: nicotinate-nucleotide adenylyltransferase [Acidobacteriota bacterium]